MSRKPAPTVLIVDDNDMMRTLLRGILRNENYTIVGEARNGVAAVEMATRLRPKLVCLDLNMPEMDGMTALAHIKTSLPDTQVVMITSSSHADDVREAVNRGAAGFIVKPFNAAKVLDTLERLTRKP
jgi:two-component system chemotaxis response regulator CheY